jgi:hypothetical protein
MNKPVYDPAKPYGGHRPQRGKKRSVVLPFKRPAR